MLSHPTTLSNRTTELRPLTLDDVESLWPQADEAEIWQYMRIGLIESPQRLLHWARLAIESRVGGTEYPFVTIDRATGRLAGSTRFMSIDAGNRTIEIGGTWLGKCFRRTAMNTSSKYLMMRYAFEDLNCIRVQLRTDLRNTRSQRAIERIGAIREGVFRKDFVYPDGYQRSTVFYSVTDSEWPGVKQRLQAMIPG